MSTIANGTNPNTPDPFFAAALAAAIDNAPDCAALDATARQLREAITSGALAPDVRDALITAGKVRRAWLTRPRAAAVSAVVASVVAGPPPGALPMMSMAPRAPAPTPAPVVRPGLDVDTARLPALRADEDMARASGFSPEATVVTFGTRVIADGTVRARQSRAKWEGLAPIGDAMVDLARAVKAEDRRDVAVKPSDLRMGTDGSIRALSSPASMPLRLTLDAFGGLLSRTKVGGADYLTRCPTALRATNVNAWFERSEIDGRSTSDPIVLRTRNAPGGGREAFATVSERYAPVDTDVIAEAVRNAYGTGGMKGDAVYDATGGRVKITALGHTDVAPEAFCAGEFFKAGVVVTSDDTGGGSLRVRSVLWRNLCLNLIIIDKASIPVAQLRHMGDPRIIARKLREALVEAQRRVAPFLAQWGVAVADDIRARVEPIDADTARPDGVTLERLIPGLYRGLIARELLPVEGRREDAVKALSLAWAREAQTPGARPESTATLVNGITRYAHESADAFASESLEAAAAQLVWPGRTGAMAPLPYATA